MSIYEVAIISLHDIWCLILYSHSKVTLRVIIIQSLPLLDRGHVTCVTYKTQSPSLNVWVFSILDTYCEMYEYFSSSNHVTHFTINVKFLKEQQGWQRICEITTLDPTYYQRDNIVFHYILWCVFSNSMSRPLINKNSNLI